MRRHHGGVRRANRFGGYRFPRLPGGIGVQEKAKRLAVDIQERDGVDLRMRVGWNSGQADAAGGPAVLACWAGPEMAVRDAQDEAPIARTMPSHTRSDSASSVS